MFTTLTAPSGRAPRTIAILAMALALAALLARAAGAEQQYTNVAMDTRARGQADMCKLDGGQATTTYTYTESGKTITSITVSCRGGASDGWVCVNTPSTIDCTKPLTRPEEPLEQPGGGVNKPVWDEDGDGLEDAAEAERGTDPRNPDTDGDGLPDGDEVHVYLTDPRNPDTDGDGADDGTEIGKGTDPTDPTA